jgi:hypothetical protein
MKPFSILSLLLLFSLSAKTQLISQYIETSSGSVPKGIEIWNNTLNELNFATNHLVIEKGTNGALPSPDFTLSSGTLASGAVIVIGTSDMQTIAETNGSTFFLKAFTFNGDDALVVKYGGVITDVFGIPGSDPGAAWSGNGVSTANQNITLREGIETGDTDGWSDPSERFATVSTDNSMTGFGVAPIRITGELTVQPSTSIPFSYVFQHGPSNSQFFNLSGNSISNDIVITPPAHFDISTNNISFISTPIILTATSGTLIETPIYIRLKENLEVGAYMNELILISSTGAESISMECNGRVKYRDDMALPNAWINEFHYDNDGTDVNEFIEIVIENATWFDLADFTTSLYNGGNGTVYDYQPLSTFNAGSVYDTFSIFTWNPASIENGSPDGIAIDYKGECISFISYEGTFTATDGPASGILSANIGKEESSTKTLVGHSLQLIGTGNQYSHFRWIDPPESPGAINTYQSFGPYAQAVPLSIRATITLFMLVALTLMINFRRKEG